MHTIVTTSSVSQQDYESQGRKRREQRKVLKGREPKRTLRAPHGWPKSTQAILCCTQNCSLRNRQITLLGFKKQSNSEIVSRGKGITEVRREFPFGSRFNVEIASLFRPECTLMLWCPRCRPINTLPFVFSVARWIFHWQKQVRGTLFKCACVLKKRNRDSTGAIDVACSFR